MKKYLLSTALAAAVLFTPAAADAALGDQTLKQGMHHADVTELQQWLKGEGFLHGSIDGIFGPVTAKAVRSYQNSTGIGADGIAGPQTFRSMGIETSSVNASASAPNQAAFSRTLRQGARGNDVRQLQQTLKRKGHHSGSIDGAFGPVTASSVRSFQRSAGIGADGIAGPQTFSALSSGNVKSSTSSQTTSNSSAGFTDKLVSNARNYIGSPYVWGGTSPSGFDCSGYLQYVFNKAGKSIPRTVASIYKASSKVSNPSVGDLVFFETYTSGPSHAGIYLGGGQFIHAGSSTGVTIANMSSSYWKQRYLGAGRLS
ncbi:peptidoglycan-binding protein [Alteribacillus sp. YIM 98480]|uniref:C40 family peptidase n=1 Tax=Alteribacillus sp. YIM 98480 TaxID=2606599 RepID=UPI00131A86ED|nr:peptidoglycan-binding protein [Alteribacillus sp. YIM 98480]